VRRKDLAVGDGRSRVARFAKIVCRQKLEFFRVRSKDGRDASSARDIELPGGQYDRTPALASVESLGPQDFPGLTFNALSRSRPGIDDIHPPIDHHARADPLRLFLQPVRCGHVAGSAQLEANRRSSDPPGERDADTSGDHKPTGQWLNCFDCFEEVTLKSRRSLPAREVRHDQTATVFYFGEGPAGSDRSPTPFTVATV